MTYYHETKEAAEEAARIYEPYFHVRVALESYNGFVITLTPRSFEVFKFPLWDLLDKVELDLTGFNLVRIKPADRNRPAPVAAKARASTAAPRADGEPASAPVKGATAKVWAIADRITAEKGGTIDRARSSRPVRPRGLTPQLQQRNFRAGRKLNNDTDT